VSSGDTTLRIGAKLNLFPKKVYLHPGTRRSARALGLDAGPTAPSQVFQQTQVILGNEEPQVSTS